MFAPPPWTMSLFWILIKRGEDSGVGGVEEAAGRGMEKEASVPGALSSNVACDTCAWDYAYMFMYTRESECTRV